MIGKGHKGPLAIKTVEFLYDINRTNTMQDHSLNLSSESCNCEIFLTFSHFTVRLARITMTSKRKLYMCLWQNIPQYHTHAASSPLHSESQRMVKSGFYFLFLLTETDFHPINPGKRTFSKCIGLPAASGLRCPAFRYGRPQTAFTGKPL